MRRPFRILDGVIFFVNLASGLALARSLARGLYENRFPWFDLANPSVLGPIKWLFVAVQWLYAGMLMLSPILLSLTMSLGASWMVAPKPPAQRLWRLRGARPLLIVLVAIVIGIVVLALLAAAEELSAGRGLLSYILVFRAFPFTYSLISMCLSAFVLISVVNSRRRATMRSAPHWRDTLGRWVARGWIAILPLGLVTPVWFLLVCMVAALYAMVRASDVALPYHDKTS